MDRIRLRGVSKRFSRLAGAKLLANWGFWQEDSGPNWFWALDQVDLTLSGYGKRLAVVGANGSGKSTLLRIIAGVTRPTYGSVMVNGRIIPLLEVFTGLQPDLTGRENIYFNGTLMGMRRREIQRKFDHIVDFAGISSFLDMPVKHYSSGMRMRLGFSVASYVDADIILADEIWSIGDVEFQSKSLRRLEETRQRGTSIIFVSNDLDLLRQNSDEALWLQKGRVAALGPSDLVIKSYLQTARHNLPPAS